MSDSRVILLDPAQGIGAEMQDGLKTLGVVEAVADEAGLRGAMATGTVDLVLAVPARGRAAVTDALEWLAAVHPDTPVVLAGAGDDLAAGVEALAATAGAPVTAPPNAAAVRVATEQALAAATLRREYVRLQHRLDAVARCDRLIRSLDPATVYAVALDLLLEGSIRRRGLAHFRRPSLPGSDGLIFRGFTREDARELRRALARTEPLAHDGVDAPEIVAQGPLHDLLRDLGIDDPGAALIVPLTGQEREAGVLFVFDEGETFGEMELERARVIADHAQIALENAERYHGAKARALIDDTTGLYNLRHLLEAADHELERASRYGLELSILFVDIDRFKRVNDAHGHLVGTGTLRHVAERLQERVRQIDALARYGGDEFTVLLTDSSPEAAKTAAERIRRAVEEAVFHDERGARVSVTVSIGVACYPHDSRTRDELVDLADKAMYRAKSLGRNRVAMAQELEPDG